MSHTHTNLLCHIVFSTQGHLPLITNEIMKELFAYMGGLVKELKGKPIIINGMSDHVVPTSCDVGYKYSVGSAD